MASGRSSSAGEIRELLTLITSLQESGDTVSVEGIANRLGVPEAHAEHLLEQILTCNGSHDTHLPLIEDEEGRELTLTLVAQSLRGKPLRLTTAETLALIQALVTLGFDHSDPLLQKLLLKNEVSNLTHIIQSFTASDTHQPPKKMLLLCAEALIVHKALSFTYERPGHEEKQYFLTPEHVYLEHGEWRVRGIDVHTKREKSFLVRYMNNTSLELVRDITPIQEPQIDTSTPHSTHIIQVTIRDQRALQLFEWLYTQQHTTATGETVLDIPRWKGSWLTRRLASCGDWIHIEDAELRDEVARYKQVKRAELERLAMFHV